MKSLRSLCCWLGGFGGGGESKLKIEWQELTELWLLGRSPLCLSLELTWEQKNKHFTLANNKQRTTVLPTYCITILFDLTLTKNLL